MIRNTAQVEKSRPPNLRVGTLEQFAIALGLCFLLFFGVFAGDATDGEAATVLALRAGNLVPASPPGGSAYAWTAHVLAGLQPVLRWGPGEITVAHVRSLNVALLALVGILAYVWQRAVLCRSSAALGLLFMGCSAPVLVLSTTATDDAWLVVLVVALVRAVSAALQPATEAPMRARLVWIAGAGVALAGVASMLAPSSIGGAEAALDERIMAALGTLACGLPAGLVAVGRSRSLLASLDNRVRCYAGAQLGLVAMGLLVSFLEPSRIWGGGGLVAVGLGGLAALSWHQWLHDRMDVGTRRRHERLIALVSIGTPAAAIVAATARIATVYQFMERVQAIVVVGLASFVVAVILIRRRWYPAAWLPILALAIAFKCTYAIAHLPERNVERGVRAFAAAVRGRLPNEAILATNLPLGPAFAYYLDLPVLSVPTPTAAGPTPASHLLLYDEELCRLISDSTVEWQRVRLFEGPFSRRLVLARRTRHDVLETANRTPTPEQDGERTAVRPSRPLK